MKPRKFLSSSHPTEARSQKSHLDFFIRLVAGPAPLHEGPQATAAGRQGNGANGARQVRRPVLRQTRPIPVHGYLRAGVRAPSVKGKRLSGSDMRCSNRQSRLKKEKKQIEAGKKSQSMKEMKRQMSLFWLHTIASTFPNFSVLSSFHVFVTHRSQATNLATSRSLSPKGSGCSADAHVYDTATTRTLSQTGPAKIASVGKSCRRGSTGSCWFS